MKRYVIKLPNYQFLVTQISNYLYAEVATIYVIA